MRLNEEGPKYGGALTAEGLVEVLIDERVDDVG